MGSFNYLKSGKCVSINFHVLNFHVKLFSVTRYWMLRIKLYEFLTLH